MVFYLVINLSEAAAVARVQKVRNPAGERAVRSEESLALQCCSVKTTDAKKGKSDRLDRRRSQGHDEATQRGFGKNRKSKKKPYQKLRLRARLVCLDK